MKVKKLIKKMYEACVTHDSETEQKMWRKLLEKSLKNKDTHSIR